MEDFVIKEIDKSEVPMDNSNNLIVIVSETGPTQPTELNKTKINKGDQMFEKLIPEEYKALINTKFENESSEEISRDVFTFYLMSNFVTRNSIDFETYRLIIGYTDGNSFFVQYNKILAVIAISKNDNNEQFGSTVHEFCHFLGWLSRGRNNTISNYELFAEEIFGYVTGWLLDKGYLDKRSWIHYSEKPWEKSIDNLDYESIRLRLLRFISNENSPVDIVKVVSSKVYSRLTSKRGLEFLWLIDRAARNLQSMLLSPTFDQTRDIRNLCTLVSDDSLLQQVLEP